MTTLQQRRVFSDTDGSPEFVARSVADEIANTVTHAIGLVMSLIGAVILIATVWRDADIWLAIGCSVYALSLIAVYAASTLSHWCSEPVWRQRFRALDQGVIYLLIVGTFTPFVVAYLRSGPWLAYLGLLWAIALGGFISKVFLSHRVESVSLWLYLALGWMPVMAVKPLLGTVAPPGLWWMLIGGVCYTLGTLFLIFDQRVPYFHAIWHLCVIAGAACHFSSILLYVAGA
jgi:hemolysin III